MTRARAEPSLAELAGDLAAGRLDAESMTERAIASHRPEWHAYRAFDPERARGEAIQARDRLSSGRARPLTGVPVSVKDLYGVDGFDTCAGSPRPLPARFERSGPVVRALIAQGAVVMGKTHTVQFAFGGLGTNPHFPTPLNPWDAERKRVAGGSSSGAGVSLCEGSARLALGTDTAGSVRIPASMTGNVGLKLTAGRWSTEGIVPLSPTLDTPGLLARTAVDLRLAFVALDADLTERSPETNLAARAPGPDPRGTAARDAPAALRGVRLARAAEECLWQGCSLGVAEAVESVVSQLARLGVSVEPRALPEAPRAIELFSSGSPVGLELATFLRSELPGFVDTLDPNVVARLDFRSGDEERSRRVSAIRRLSELARPRWAEVDAFVFPTVAITPPALGEIASPEEYRRHNWLALRNTSVANFLGLCALTLPAGLDARGLPVGLQLLGAPHAEHRLLEIAVAIEAALGSFESRAGSPPRLSGAPGPPAP